MGFFTSFRDAMDGRAGREYRAAGTQVRCTHCGGVEFERSEAQLNTAGLTFLGLDWANRTACALICPACGHIEWFADGDKVEAL